MGILDYIKPVNTISPEDFQKHFKYSKIEDYNLIDVRQPGEYEAEHIPGSRLIPLGELHDKITGFNMEKPTIVYCAVGGRSRAAASILMNAGFKEVYSLEGGIKALHGPKSIGAPEYGTVYFRGTEDAGELLALSWALEENTIRYYQFIMKKYNDDKIRDFFSALISVEEGHKDMINSLYKKEKSGVGKGDFPDYYASLDDIDEVLEGGLKLSRMLKWADGKSIKEIIDLSIGLEAQLFDIYTKMLAVKTDEHMKNVITRLANDEKQHLNRFIRFYEEFL